MLISADVRPRNLKKGVSLKKFCEALGFKDMVGLRQLCGRLELSGETQSEFAFLTALNEAFCPWHDKSSRIVVEIDGKQVCSYVQGAFVPAKEEKK